MEIKPTPGQALDTGRACAALMSRIWPQTEVPPLFTSFQPEALQGARDGAPHIPRGLLVDQLADSRGERDLQTALDLQCQVLVLNHQLWTAELIARVHGAGLRCSCYTVNDDAAAQRLLDIGCDAVITDRVDHFSPAQQGPRL